jgi:hypothetical protein
VACNGVISILAWPNIDVGNKRRRNVIGVIMSAGGNVGNDVAWLAARIAWRRNGNVAAAGSGVAANETAINE